MTHVRLKFEVTLSLKSPFLFRGLTPKARGFDASALRNEDDVPIIPADQIRGVLKEAFEDLQQVGAISQQDLKALFGEKSHSEREDIYNPDENNEPLRGKLITRDFEAIEDLKPVSATRIKIDNNSGTVEKGALQVYELVAPQGQRVDFRGSIIIYSQMNNQWEKRLTQAFKLMTAIGSMKSVGFGEVLTTEVVLSSIESLIEVPKEKQLTLNVTFDRPLLVDAEWIAGNAMLGASVVPGGVLKGALAEKLKNLNIAYNEVELSQMRISHAFPLFEGKILEPLALSTLAHKSDGKVKNAFVDGVEEDYSFQPWKEKVRKNFPELKPLSTETRTHTAIKDSIAKNENLFTTIARSNKNIWQCHVDFKNASEKIIQQLLNGLDNIGKTQASAKFTIANTIKTPFVQPVSETYELMLHTPALMFDANELVDENGQWKMSARDAYATYFKDLYGLKLHNHFAKQKWAGRYLPHRFKPYGSNYFPFLLTEAGSVFQLSGWNDKLREGLIVPKINSTVPSWKNCPFMPENGFGQVKIVSEGGNHG